MNNLSVIVAVSQNNVIGIKNTLPWHLPEDLQRFKALTTGHHIIMGRKTYESLGRLLPNRITVIVTRNKDFKVEGAIVTHTLESAITLCKDDNEPFLIGGAELYKSGIKLANKLYLTQVNTSVEGDAFFADIDLNEWQLSEKKDHISTSGLSYSDLIYVKN